MKVVQPIRDQAAIDGIKYYLRIRSMRDYLFFCFGIYSGLRVSDLLRLQVKMVRGKTHVQITEKKNVHDKQFIIHPSIREDLEHYIKNMKDDDFIFPSRRLRRRKDLENSHFTGAQRTGC
ncbi:tyrosine-type recombinase/integrase (plasmid) [Paenibacillus cellulosilyticus]|nr:tyrosine-type recombinase/integrase [Paenibacillus cellulosilyticus]